MSLCYRMRAVLLTRGEADAAAMMGMINFQKHLGNAVPSPPTPRFLPFTSAQNVQGRI